MNLPQRPPSWRPDREIQNDLLRKLNQNPLIDMNNVTINVNQGNVFLDGEVPTPHHINILEETARKIRGVLEVINNLGPHGTGPGPDDDVPGIGEDPNPPAEGSGSHGPGPGPDD